MGGRVQRTVATPLESADVGIGVRAQEARDGRRPVGPAATHRLEERRDALAREKVDMRARPQQCLARIDRADKSSRMQRRLRVLGEAREEIDARLVAREEGGDGGATPRLRVGGARRESLVHGAVRNRIVRHIITAARGGRGARKSM